MACWINLCFALEFSLKASNLQIISDFRCWKVTIPYCQQCAGAEHVLHIWGTKCLATARLKIYAGGFSKLRAGGWYWDAFPRPPRCWRYGGSWWRCPRVGCPRRSAELLPSITCPGKCSSSPAGLTRRGSLLRLHCPGCLLIYTCSIWLEQLEITKRVLGAGSLRRSLQVVAGKGDWGCPGCAGHVTLCGAEQGGLEWWGSASWTITLISVYRWRNILSPRCHQWSLFLDLVEDVPAHCRGVGLDDI